MDSDDEDTEESRSVARRCSSTGFFAANRHLATCNVDRRELLSRLMQSNVSHILSSYHASHHRLYGDAEYELSVFVNSGGGLLCRLRMNPTATLDDVLWAIEPEVTRLNNGRKLPIRCIRIGRRGQDALFDTERFGQHTLAELGFAREEELMCMLSLREATQRLIGGQITCNLVPNALNVHPIEKSIVFEIDCFETTEEWRSMPNDEHKSEVEIAFKRTLACTRIRVTRVRPMYVKRGENGAIAMYDKETTLVVLMLMQKYSLPRDLQERILQRQEREHGESIRFFRKPALTRIRPFHYALIFTARDEGETDELKKGGHLKITLDGTDDEERVKTSLIPYLPQHQYLAVDWAPLKLAFHVYPNPNPAGESAMPLEGSVRSLVIFPLVVC